MKTTMAVLVLAAVPGAALPAAALSSPAAAHVEARAPLPLFTFGPRGGFMRPLTVTIGADGTVRVVGGAGAGAAPGHLAPDTVAGLLTLARAENFFHMPARIVGKGLPDIGGRSITIRTGQAAKTVFVRYVRNAAFDQLYGVLMAVAGQAQ